MGYLIAALFMIFSIFLIVFSRLAYHTYHGDLPKLFKTVVFGTLTIALVFVLLEFAYRQGMIDLRWMYHWLLEWLDVST